MTQAGTLERKQPQSVLSAALLHSLPSQSLGLPSVKLWSPWGQPSLRRAACWGLWVLISDWRGRVKLYL